MQMISYRHDGISDFCNKFSSYGVIDFQKLKSGRHFVCSSIATLDVPKDGREFHIFSMSKLGHKSERVNFLKSGMNHLIWLL